MRSVGRTAFKIHKTTHPSVGFCKQDVGLWRFVDITETRDPDVPRFVGPQYPSRAVLLADMNRYLDDCWR